HPTPGDRPHVHHDRRSTHAPAQPACPHPTPSATDRGPPRKNKTVRQNIRAVDTSPSALSGNSRKAFHGHGTAEKSALREQPQRPSSVQRRTDETSPKMPLPAKPNTSATPLR